MMEHWCYLTVEPQQIQAQGSKLRKTSRQKLVRLNADSCRLCRWVLGVPLLRSLVQGILPGLALRLFIALLPILLWLLNMRSGHANLSAVDFAVIRQFFIFQVVLVFFTSFIAGECGASSALSLSVRRWSALLLCSN